MSDAPPSYDPPPYAPPSDESKGLYLSVPSEQRQQQQQLPLAAPAAAPHQSSVTYYPPTGLQQEQQQSQQLIASVQTPVVVRESEHVQSYMDHISLSCFVIWCCAWPCGLIAFSLASK